MVRVVRPVPVMAPAITKHTWIFESCVRRTHLTSKAVENPADAKATTSGNGQGLRPVLSLGALVLFTAPTRSFNWRSSIQRPFRSRLSDCDDCREFHGIELRKDGQRPPRRWFYLCICIEGNSSCGGLLAGWVMILDYSSDRLRVRQRFDAQIRQCSVQFRFEIGFYFSYISRPAEEDCRNFAHNSPSYSVIRITVISASRALKKRFSS